MVYNKDPILPFEYKDKLNYHSDTYLEGKNDTDVIYNFYVTSLIVLFEWSLKSL